MMSIDPVDPARIRPRLIRSSLAIAMTIALLLGAASASARSDGDLSFKPELDKGLLGEGRQAYRERSDPGRARDAYRIFKQNYDENPGDSTAAWHLSMACYFVGIRVEREPSLRKAIYQEGRDIADRALVIDPDCGPCHLFSAINHALWADQIGVLRVIVGLPLVKNHLDRSATLDPKFAGAAALRTQAAIAERLPRMFGGGDGKARAFIEQAIAVAPEEPLNYEMLVNLLVEHFHDRDRALAVARRALAIPVPGPEYVESRDSLAYLQRFVDAQSTVVSRSGR